MIEEVDSPTILKLSIIKANFQDDKGDFIGKQDPYIVFDYKEISYHTNIVDDGGMVGEWNEVFFLDKINEALNDTLCFRAYDMDHLSSDLLSQTSNLSIASIYQECLDNKHKTILKSFKLTNSDNKDQGWLYVSYSLTLDSIRQRYFDNN